MDNQFPQEQTLNLGIGEHAQGQDDPPKRRPGRPRGSVKKALLGTETPPTAKVKRPVGRPRKDGLPAGSVPGSSKTKRERLPPQQGLQFVAEPVAYPAAMPVYPPQPAPQQFVSAQPVIQIDPSLAADDWTTLARTDANQFLSAILAALAAPNPISTAGPTVEEAFKSHLVSVTPNANQVNPIPTLYSILKTFWLPSSPAYFSLTASAASTSRTSSEHRFLYWDPLPLVFNGIHCPHCGAPLLNKGRITTGPLKIYDIEKPFFIIGCEYVCKSPQCTSSTSSEGRKFASTDSSILRALPVKLRDEFPAKLLYDNADAGSGAGIWCWKPMGVSWSLWNMVHGALRAGLKKEMICFLVGSVQRGGQSLEDVGGAGGGQQAAQQQAAAQQQQAQQQQAQQQQAQQQQHLQQQDAMQQDDDTQALQHEEPSNNLSEAYSNAWRENTAMATTVAAPITATTTGDSAVKSPGPPPGVQAVQAQGQGQGHPGAQQQGQGQGQNIGQNQAQPQSANTATVGSSNTNTIQPTPTQPQPQPQTQGFPYPPYPFTPYAYMSPHGLVNGQIVGSVGVSTPQGVDASSHQPHQHPHSEAIPIPIHAPPSISTAPHPSVVPSSNAHTINTGGPPPLSTAAIPATTTTATTGTTTTTTATKRSPRHCCKCGSQDCKGKGGRNFCVSACQDCGKMDCKGRNSRRPDKKCSEGWI